MAWDSQQYLKFANERNRPCLDLISKLQGDFNTILDLGCGPGNSSKNLFHQYRYAKIVGFDADENMLEKARYDCPNLELIKGRAPDDFDKLNTKFDLVFSNACIHWIENQENLIEEIAKLLNQGGVFAAQIPATDEALFYKILNELIRRKWSKLRAVKNFHSLNPSGYYHVLIKYFSEIEMWQTHYYHIVEKQMILEWYKGSGLRTYLSLLDDVQKKEFLDDLQMEIDRTYSELADGKSFLIMPRFFFIAKK